VIPSAHNIKHSALATAACPGAELEQRRSVGGRCARGQLGPHLPTSTCRSPALLPRSLTPSTRGQQEIDCDLNVGSFGRSLPAGLEPDRTRPLRPPRPRSAFRRLHLPSPTFAAYDSPLDEHLYMSVPDAAADLTLTLLTPSCFSSRSTRPAPLQRQLGSITSPYPFAPYREVRSTEPLRPAT
jgi:hypothetical protein